MTPKERVNAAMNLKPVDRIPLMCQMSIGHMLQQLDVSPVDFWFDKNAFADGLIKLRDIYDFDGILISLHGHYSDWRDKIVSQVTQSDGIIRVEMNDGGTYTFPPDDLPEYEPNRSTQSISFENITKADLPPELNYIPVSQNLRFEIDAGDKFGVITNIVEKCGEKFSIHGEITSPFDYLLDFIGHQEALMALIDDPEKCKMILAHFTELICGLAGEMCGTGIDAVKISSPFAGAGFISPDYYREFVFPFEKQVVNTIRGKAVHAYIHTCGAIDDRLEQMFETGASGIECLDPPPLGNVELENAIERIAGRGFIKGNIDSVNTLLMSGEDEIREDAVRRIEAGKLHGGFILSTACSIAPMVKRENILILKEIVEQWG